MHKYVYMSDWTTAGSLTTVRGKWTFKQGVEYRANIYSDPNIYEGSVGIYSARMIRLSTPMLLGIKLPRTPYPLSRASARRGSC